MCTLISLQTPFLFFVLYIPFYDFWLDVFHGYIRPFYSSLQILQSKEIKFEKTRPFETFYKSVVYKKYSYVDPLRRWQYVRIRISNVLYQKRRRKRRRRNIFPKIKLNNWGHKNDVGNDPSLVIWKVFARKLDSSLLTLYPPSIFFWL